MEEPMKKLISTAVAAALVLGVVAAAVTFDNQGAQTRAEAANSQLASTPISTTEFVEPYVLRTESGGLVGPGGNVTCEQVGEFEYTSDRTDYTEGGPDNFTVELTDVATNMVVGSADVTYDPATKTLDFVAGIPIEAVIVKGGDDANIYDYRPGSTMADTGLGAPMNAGGQSADLSNITLCSNPQDNPNPNNWCSPGYWRNHPAAWEPTGFSRDDNYVESTGENVTLSRLGMRSGANPNPTLGEVVDGPQFYGGEAFNIVGDLLSAAHPDVDFDGERTEDSCPLS